MQLKSIAVCTLSLMFMLLAIPSRGVAQTTLYDNFSNGVIDPAKWLGLESYDEGKLEAKRELTPTPGVQGDHRLHLLQRGYSSTTDNLGGTGAFFGLLFAAPSSISAVSFTTVVKTEKVVGCSGNPTLAQVATGFEGAFFNTSNAQNGAQGDVRAHIVIARNSIDTGTLLNVSAGYFECNDATCATATQLFSQGLGAVKANSSNTLSLKWDQAHHQFAFQLNNDTPVTSAYAINDSFPPVGDFKYLNAARAVPHCTTTPRPFALVESYFDNVYVNP